MVLERLKKALLTEHELMLYEYLEGHSDDIPYGILNNMQNTVYTRTGRIIIKGAIRRWNHRHMMADLMQRIANNGLSAQEAAEANEKVLHEYSGGKYIVQSVSAAKYAEKDMMVAAGTGNMIHQGLDVGAGLDGKKNIMLREPEKQPMDAPWPANWIYMDDAGKAGHGHR